MRHVPKKLTDCPENLRESIDWLIQVRHGNGEGGKGLDELAKALKKLIEEAIEKAEKSLNDRESKLRCTGKATDSSSSNPSVKPCCQEKDAEIKEAEKKMNGLKSSSTEESEKQIDEQNAKIKKAEASKNDCAKSHYLPEEERTKGLEEVRQQRKIVEKLKTFKDSLNNDSNNILTHLCDGLEKFLGFDSDSKGYDGSGIVYSDLDRLCDAVMGFLYGVLKDVSEKQPYAVGKKTLIKLIDEQIKPKLCSGHEGFKRLFEKLPAGIEKYNREVQQGNEKISDPINELIKYVKKEGDGAFYNGTC